MIHRVVLVPPQSPSYTLRGNLWWETLLIAAKYVRTLRESWDKLREMAARKRSELCGRKTVWAIHASELVDEWWIRWATKTRYVVGIGRVREGLEIFVHFVSVKYLNGLIKWLPNPDRRGRTRTPPIAKRGFGAVCKKGHPSVFYKVSI